MAKGKGKKSRRIRDWQQRYQGAEEDRDLTARRQKVAARGVKIPADRLEAPETNLEELPKADSPAMVVVRVGDEHLRCAIVKTFRSPERASALAVGDEVTLALSRSDPGAAQESDGDRVDAMILSRAPRRSALSRPQPRSDKKHGLYDYEPFEKVIVANMELLAIVVSVNYPPIRPRLIDRYLIAAERGEMAVLLIVNKIDMEPAPAWLAEEMARRGIAMTACSAATGQGMDALADALRGRRSVLAGASGVGKSTLINALIPGAEAFTQEVKEKTLRGRHTTTAACVYDFPGGGLVVDTPGIRELGMPIDPAQLAWYFPEFDPFAQSCHFSDCTHTHEPGCAVIAAVENSQVSRRRYDSYVRLRESLDD
ncbi:MAG: ribosome small subunit-dependent GTPase A [Planctomycetota bacterium]|nr:ribosome small subunit-dependent GTPase A [Planctomycetota bacterium]